MRKGVPNKRYTGEFKQMVVETMRKEKLDCVETAKRYIICPHPSGVCPIRNQAFVSKYIG